MKVSKAATSRHVEYALGYVGLGLLNEASDELEAIDFSDRFRPEVLAARVELHMAAKHWDVVIGVARELTIREPQNEQGWISHAFALRELDRIAEAQAVLLAAEPLHGETTSLLHYNLACYACLLGNKEEAKRRLRIACKSDNQWKKAALDDPDLKAMWDDIATMR